MWESDENVAAAQLHVRRSEWDDAARTLSRVASWQPLTDHAFEYASLLLLLGDNKSYEDFLRKIIDEAGSKIETPEAYVFARTCGVARQTAVDSAQVIDWANLALTGSRAAWVLHASGLAQYRAGQLDRALQSLNEARAAPWGNNDLCWLGLALVHRQLGHAAEARQCLAKGVEWIERVRSAGTEQMVNIPPQDWLEAHVLLREAEATFIAECSTRIDENANDAEAWSGRGDTFLCLHQYEKAIADYSKAMELDANNLVVRRRRGEAFFGLGQWREAADDLTTIIELSPDDPEAWHKRGLAHANLGETDKAIADFARLRPLLTENDVDLCLTAGNYWRGQKQFDEAVRNYDRAIELNGQRPDAWLDRGYTRLLEERWDVSVGDFSAAIDRGAGGAAFTWRAVAYLQLGRASEAVADGRKLWGSDAEARNNLAWFLCTCEEPKFRNPARALELAKKAVELDSRSGNRWNTLGVAYYRAGQWNAATESLDKSMKLHKGGDAFDWFFLAMAHWRLGNKEQARKWYDEAIKWMEKNQSNNAELQRFRTEAADLLAHDDE